MDSKLFERLTKPEKDKTVKSKELWSINQLAIQGTLEIESPSPKSRAIVSGNRPSRRCSTASEIQDLGIAESQLRDYQARLGKPFMREAFFLILGRVEHEDMGMNPISSTRRTSLVTSSAVHLLQWQ